MKFNLGHGRSFLSNLAVIVSVFVVVFFYTTVIGELYKVLGLFDRRILFSQKKWWIEMLCKRKSPDSSFGHSLRLERFLEDVFPEKVQTDNIFMLESDCKYKLSERFLCGAESTARYNPSATVWFLTVTHYVDNQKGFLRRLMKEVPNIKVVVADLDLIFKNTPFTKFNQTKKWTDVEEYIPFDIRDSVRLALIYRFGGTFLDADIISLTALPENPNVMVKMSDGEMWNVFLKAGSHNEAVELAMTTMASHYNGSTWGAIGHIILGKAMRIHDEVADENEDDPERFQFLEQETFQPISAPDSTKIFETNFNFTGLNSLMNGSYGLHFSNSVTKDLEAEIGSHSLMESLAKRHCPTIYQEMVENNVI